MAFLRVFQRISNQRRRGCCESGSGRRTSGLTSLRGRCQRGPLKTNREGHWGVGYSRELVAGNEVDGPGARSQRDRRTPPTPARAQARPFPQTPHRPKQPAAPKPAPSPHAPPRARLMCRCRHAPHASSDTCRTRWCALSVQSVKCLSLDNLVSPLLASTRSSLEV